MESIIKQKFYFVRHGKTAWNDKRLCQGQVDIELNEEGRLEALRLAPVLADFNFSVICTSPLKRALETAQLLQQFLPHCHIHLIDELKEGVGELEGASSEEMYYIEEQEEKGLYPPLQKGIEPRELFKKRIAIGINLALKQGDNALIISHGRVFLSLCELLNIPLVRQVPNACLVECLPVSEGWKLKMTPSNYYQ